MIKFNPVDKSITTIGPDLGDDDHKWYGGAMTGSGVIYCPPNNSNHHGILKIDTNTDTVTELDAHLFLNEVMVVCGTHVLPLSMDVFTLYLVMLVAS